MPSQITKTQAGAAGQMIRIDDTFARLRGQGRKAFEAIIMAGDRDAATSPAVVQ